MTNETRPSETRPSGSVGLAPHEDALLRRTYWAVVGRSYWRGHLNRIATFFILLIALLTIIVPFLANSSPYIAVIDGHREFPLFRNLTRVDWIWLLWGFLASFFALIFWRTGKRNIEIEPLRAQRLRWGLALAAVGILLSTGIVLFKNDYLDSRDYHQLARAGELHNAVFPPLRWGFSDQEPLDANRLYETPSREHFLGTDSNGRDALARLLWSTRIVLEIGLISEIIALTIGAIYGAFMGYFVGKIDILGMRFVEIVEAIPLLFLLITFVAIFGRQLFMIMVIIGVTGWTGIARFVRAEFLRIRQLDYVTAAKSLGLPLPNILFRHMLPNGLTPVIVTFTFGVAGNIVSESILSFLGIGVEPPTASWGAMLDQAGNPGEVFRWWLAFPPGLMIFLTVFAYNITGEGLRDAIDPRTNKTI
ncbi:MAG: ABC transporter permease [Phycisphaerales bacterium]|nr:ABC transporter permease [Phycisphaerales bacterium]